MLITYDPSCNRDSKTNGTIVTKEAVAVAKSEVSLMTRVGQWMSKEEYVTFTESGLIPRTNVLTKGKEGYINKLTKVIIM